MKEPVDKIDAVPSKRLFLSIISDYNLDRSICELIDNALDNWIKDKKINKVSIDLDFNFDQQTISIQDNSGGLPKSGLKFIVGPGQTSNDPSDDIIGIFGVGTKRAVVALSQDIKISTRYKGEPTYMVEFDDAWLESEDWELQVYKVSDIPEGSTYIQLQRLRNKIDEEKIPYLKKHLQRTYAKFLSNKKIKISVNSKELTPIEFENWAYPPKHPPQKLSGILPSGDGKTVKVSILAGLTRESSPAGGEFGVYFYCNNRLIDSELKNFEVGFARGLAGLPHASVSLVRVIVSLEGEAWLMPWNSSKSAIHYDHRIFRALQNSLIQVVKHYASLSRALEGQWPNKVFKYGSGRTSIKSDLVFPDIRKLHFPPVPKSKPRYEDKIRQANKRITTDKPWTKGLLGGMIAADLISNKKFEEKNRITLIVLDSTLEISFKEYLVNDSDHHYTNKDLVRIFKQRHLVEQEVKKYVALNKTLWKKIKHYYDFRCKLVHERASVGISDEQIDDYFLVVRTVLKKLFKFKFE